MNVDLRSLESLLSMLREHGVVSFEAEGLKIALRAGAEEPATPATRVIDPDPGPPTWRGFSADEAASLGLIDERPDAAREPS